MTYLPSIGGQSGVINVTQSGYQADPSGSSYAHTPINQAISDSATGGRGIVYLPPGDFKMGASLVGSSLVDIIGASPGLTRLLFDDVAVNGFSINAGLGPTLSTTLTADLAEYANTVTVTSATGFVQGDLVYFSSSTSGYGTWCAQILGISGTTITLDGYSPANLLVSDGVTMAKYSWAHDFVLADLTIQCSVANPVNFIRPLSIGRAYKGLIERVNIDTSAQNIAELHIGRDLTIKSMKGDNCIGGGGQGIYVQGVTGAEIEARTRNCSTGLQLDGSPNARVEGRYHGTSSGNYGIAILNGSNRTRVKPSVVSGSTTGIRISDSWGWTLDAPEIDSTPQGIYASCALAAGRMRDGVISAPTILNTSSYAIQFEAKNIGDVLNCQVLGGDIAKGGSHGVYVDRGTLFTVNGTEFHGLASSSYAVAISYTAGSLVDSAATISAVQVNGSRGAFLQCHGAHIIGSDFRGFTDDGIVIPTVTGNPAGNIVERCNFPGSAGLTPVSCASTGGNAFLENQWPTGAFPNLQPNDTFHAPPRRVVLTDGANVASRPTDGDYFFVSVAGSRTISIPSICALGATITYDIQNSSGGAIVTTWATGTNGFKVGNAWTDPGNGSRSIISFRFDGSNWIPLGPAAVTS